MDGKVKAYQTTDTLGKSQIDLVIKIYDGAIAAYRQSHNNFQEDNVESGKIELEKAKKFVTHLYSTLDMKKGGEIAENLSKLYAFVINQSNVASATKDLTIIDDNINIMDDLRQGWIELKNQQVQTPTEPNQDKRQTITESFTTSA